VSAVASGGDIGYRLAVAIHDVAEVAVIPVLAAEAATAPAHGNHAAVIRSLGSHGYSGQQIGKAVGGAFEQNDVSFGREGTSLLDVQRFFQIPSLTLDRT
jgi:hypothetical protein